MTDNERDKHGEKKHEITVRIGAHDVTLTQHGTHGYIGWIDGQAVAMTRAPTGDLLVSLGWTFGSSRGTWDTAAAALTDALEREHLRLTRLLTTPPKRRECRHCGSPPRDTWADALGECRAEDSAPYDLSWEELFEAIERLREALIDAPRG